MKNEKWARKNSVSIQTARLNGIFNLEFIEIS